MAKNNDYDKLAKDILKLVGDEKNVHSLVHCATRLRFVLNDRSKADKKKLMNKEGVITVQESGGQFQVVIGNNVPEVYAAIGKISNLTNENNAAKEGGTKEKGNFFERGVDVISSIFTPLLGVMAASGILKGLLAIFERAEWLSPDGSTFQILSAIGDSLFYFLPILLAVTSARKFGANQFVSMTIAGALVYPTMIEMTESGVAAEFFSIPVILMPYTSSVIPIILAVYVQSVLEKFFNKTIHETIKNFITPLLSLIIITPLTLIVIGPIGTYAGNGLADIAVTLIEFNPMIAGAVIAALWQVLVIFGIHWGIIPVMINNIAVHGLDMMKPATAAAVFSQAGAVFGVMLRTKNKKFKALAGSAGVTALIGITEPAVYGVTLRLKKPFIVAVISAAVGGAITGYFGSVAVSTGLAGLLTIPIFIGESTMAFIGFLIGITVSFILSIILTYTIGFEDIPEEEEEEIAAEENEESTDNEIGDAPIVEKAEAEDLTSPISGEVLPLNKVPDPVFSTEAMGKGAAILPEEGQVVAPVDGIVEMVFETNHAIGIKSENGAEILIHIGLDTVQLEGKYFTAHVKQGDLIKTGDLLIEFDIDGIKSAGYEIITPVILTNTPAYTAIKATEKNKVEKNESFIYLS